MLTLNATERTSLGKKNYSLRQNGQMPAVIYGFIDKPLNLALDQNEFTKILRKAGESTIIALKMDNGSFNVLIQDVQRDPVRDDIIHADFRAVDMNKEIEAEVRLEFVGESPAVKGLSGTLVKPMETLLVEALPANLPSSIKVDLSKLVTFDDVVRVSDLELKEGVTILEEPDRTLAVVTPPRSDEEMAALDEAVEENVEGVEVSGEKKEAEGEGGEEKSADEDNSKPEEKE